MSAETFGALLRTYRTAAGLTQAALAERADLSEQAISALERGSRRRPRADTIKALGEALALSTEAMDRLYLAARVPKRSSSAAARGPAGDVPRQLPPNLSDFTGRAAELTSLLQLLTTADGAPGTLRVAAITGMGGVGKTALAIHAAHLAAASFPDGHLYVDLRGYGPGDPIAPAEALGLLLRTMGLEEHTIPAATHETAALYRSHLADRRMLIVLDNANGAAQITPLLPGAPGSAVLVTSRRALTTLPGVRQITLAPMSEADSVELLSKVSGDSRVSPQSDAARSIVRLTGQLPLALRLIGARLAARPTWPVDYVAEQLHDERHRLDQLGTDQSGVRANIAGSVEFLANSNDRLDQQAAAALVLLGLPNGSNLNTVTAAHLLGEEVGHTDILLERLVDLNLLDSIGPGRYRLHDLIAAFARERAHEVLSEGTRTDALTRLLKLYTGVAWTCQRLTHPDSHRLDLASPLPHSLPELPDGPAAMDWLDRERSSLLEIFHQAQQSTALRHLVPELALALFGYHEARNRWSEMRSFDAVGRDLATDFGYERLAAWLQHDLAIPDVELDDVQSARANLMQSHALFLAIDDLAGLARCCSSLSYVHGKLGLLDDAMEWAKQALTISREIGDMTVVGVSELALARLHSLRGEHDRARQSFDRSIRLAEEAGDLRSLAKRHQIAGQTYMSSGHHTLAVRSLLLSAEYFDQVGDTSYQAESLQDLATLYLASGEYERATAAAQEGLRLARATAGKRREGQLLIEMGRIKQATGEDDSARALWLQAATLLHPISPTHEAIARRLLDDA